MFVKYRKTRQFSKCILFFNQSPSLFIQAGDDHGYMTAISMAGINGVAYVLINPAWTGLTAISMAGINEVADVL